MTIEEAIKQLKKCKSFHNGSYGEALNMAIKALEIVNDFERAQIITGGRLNGRTYAYKCGLADGQRLERGEKLFNILPLEQQPSKTSGSTYGGVSWGGTYKPPQPCEDCISKIRLLEHLENITMDTNPDHYEDKNKWYQANGFNLCKVGIEMYVKNLPPVTPKAEPCEDCISREAVNTLVDELARAISDERCCMPRGRSTATIMQDILDLSSVTPQPKVGHWITTRTFMHDGEFYCDNCKCDAPNNEKWDYCPNCGVKMEVEE